MKVYARQLDNDFLRMSDDGRTVEGRIVPYNEVTEITETNDAGEVVKYREQFLPHACARMAQGCAQRGNASFIGLTIDHEDGFAAKVGHAAEIRDEDDGAHAVFRLYTGRDLEKVQSMLRESHTGLSVEFYDVKPPRIIDEVISRVQVGIRRVAATALPAYAGAGITNIREGEPPLCERPELERVRLMLAEIKR